MFTPPLKKKKKKKEEEGNSVSSSSKLQTPPPLSLSASSASMMMMATTDGRKDDGNNTNRETAAAGSTTPTPPSSSSKKKKKKNSTTTALENHVALLTKERDEARRFGETTVALFKKEKLALKNEAKETQVNALNEKRMWEQERKGLKEDVARLESEVERMKKEKEEEEKKKVATNGDKNDEISLTEFLDVEAALEKERERSAHLERDLEAKAKEYATKNEQTKIEISKMTAERETLKANAKNMYKKLNEWDQMQAENQKAHEALLRKEVEVHKQHYQNELERAQKEHEFHLQYEKNQKEQQYERYEREKNELAEREYSKYRREVERAVSDARMKAEEEFNEKIERYERDTRSKEREIRKEIRLLEIECEKMVQARVKEAVKTIAHSVEETFEKTTNTGLGVTKALDEQKMKIDALGMKCATMVGKAKIELDKIALKREEALRELANTIEVTSEKRREFEKYEEKMHHREFHARLHPHRAEISPSSEQEEGEYDDPFSPESKMSDQHNRTNGCDDENDEVHALMRQVKLLRSELESLAKNRKDESSALKKKVLRSAERKREKKKEKKEVLTSVRARLDSLMLMN